MHLPDFDRLNVPIMNQAEIEELTVMSERNHENKSQSGTLSIRHHKNKRRNSSSSRRSGISQRSNSGSVNSNLSKKFDRRFGRVSYRQKKQVSKNGQGNLCPDEYPQLAKLDQLDHQVRVSQSNAKLCLIGVEKEDNQNLLTTEQICSEKKEIKFELDPLNRMEWFNLRPEQKLILQAARTNNIEYIRQMAEKRFAKEFNFYD